MSYLTLDFPYHQRNLAALFDTLPHPENYWLITRRGTELREAIIVRPNGRYNGILSFNREGGQSMIIGTAELGIIRFQETSGLVHSIPSSPVNWNLFPHKQPFLEYSFREAPPLESSDITSIGNVSEIQFTPQDQRHYLQKLVHMRPMFPL